MNREKRRKHLFEFAKEKSKYKDLFYRIIFNAETDDFSRILRSVEGNSSMRSNMKKILFPSDMNQLCCKKFVFNQQIDWEHIRRFYYSIFQMNRDKLDMYIKLKTIFENALFSENYKKAIEILDEIEKIGMSIWCITKKFYLYDQTEGLEKHKKYLSELQNQANNNILINTILEIESYFAESNTSYSAYKKRINHYNEILGEDEVIRKYLDFKFNEEREYDIEEYKIAMIFEAQFSIIDMYETFVLIEQLVTVQGDCTVDLPNVKDFRLNNLQNITSMASSKLLNESEYYTLLDLYTCGEYEKLIFMAEKYLNKDPYDFQCIIILIKSYLILEKKPQFTNNIYTIIYDIYAMNANDTDSIQQLYSFMKIAKNTSWEYKVMGFISRKMTLDNRSRMSYISALNDVNLSPNLICNKDFKGNRVNYLQLFRDICPITKKLYLFSIGKEKDFPIEIIDENRKRLYCADKLIEGNKNNEAINQLEKIDRIDNYYYVRILRRKISVYSQMKDFLAAVICIAKAVVDNNSFCHRIDLQNIFNNININLSSEIKKNIHYVVLVYICLPGDYKKQRIAYTNYMEKNKFNSIESVINKEEKSPVLIEFLYNVCVLHLLKRDTILNSSCIKADELRVDILKALIDLDEKNRKRYYSEIESITKQKSIKDRIKQFNQNRIYVDTDNIKKENEDIFREDFHRYISMKELTDEIVAYDIYSEDYISNLKKIVDEMNEKIKTSPSYSQKIIILKDVITSITEEFLFNKKYGMNTFLSTRIRHGYCKKQLTTVFQEYNLLSKKEHDDSEEYVINEYWDNILPENTESGKILREHLSQFTYNIEKKVVEIKKNWLSIKYRENNNALLDYTNFVSKCLIIDKDNVIDFNTFYDEIIEFLWNHTSGLFNVLRKKIEEELFSYFQDELSKLSTNILSINELEVKEYVDKISNDVKLCKAKISGTTREFSNVFIKRDVTYLDFTMTELVETCINIIKKLNNNMLDVQLNEEIEDENTYRGENFPYFVDALTILINNALEHSGILEQHDLQISISVKREEDMDVLNMIESGLEKKKIRVNKTEFIRLSVTNTLSEDINIDSLKRIIAEISSKTNDPETVKEYSQKEGGTGLYKLYNTFKHNLNAAYSIFYYVKDRRFTISIVFGITNIKV